MLGKPSRRMRKKLESQGRSATATVVAISDRGMTVTNGSEGLISATELILKTKLRVEPDDGPAFEIEQRFRYPQLSVPSVGSKLSVVFDPDDHDHVMIDRTRVAGMARAVPAASGTQAPGAAGMPDLGGLLATVREAQAQGGGDREAVAEALRASLGVGGAVVVDASGAGAAADPHDPIARLEKLAALRDAGVLTEAEFAAQKARMLDAGL